MVSERQLSPSESDIHNVHRVLLSFDGPSTPLLHSFINTDNYYPDEELRIVLEGQA